jgi:hypothetical protein
MNNNFFSICNLNNSIEDDKNKIYDCCIETCTSQSSEPDMCYSLCATVFPPIIKDYCVFEQNCWKEGFYDKKCIEKNKDKIKNCCLRDCNNFKYNKNSYSSLDCEKYCSRYQVGVGYYLQNGKTKDIPEDEPKNQESIVDFVEKYTGIL